MCDKRRGERGPGRPAKHYGYAFLTRGERVLPKRRYFLKRYLVEVREGLVADLGGEERMTTAQKVLVNSAISKVGILRLFEEHLREHGLMKNGELDAVLTKAYCVFDNSLRLSLAALGIQKRPSEPDRPVWDIVAEEVNEPDQDKAKDSSSGARA